MGVPYDYEIIMYIIMVPIVEFGDFGPVPRTLVADTVITISLEIHNGSSTENNVSVLVFIKFKEPQLSPETELKFIV